MNVPLFDVFRENIHILFYVQVYLVVQLLVITFLWVAQMTMIDFYKNIKSLFYVIQP